MMSELLPCPFCGSDPKIEYWARMMSGWWILCAGCDATYRIPADEKLDEDRALLVRRWNTRARTLAPAPINPPETDSKLIVPSAECWRCALARAVHICEQEAAEWDSDAVVTDKNYAATCASRIRELAREGKRWPSS